MEMDDKYNIIMKQSYIYYTVSLLIPSHSKKFAIMVN